MPLQRLQVLRNTGKRPLREIEKLFTQEGETYAHALVHGLEIAADESVRTLKHGLKL
jgi:hypothetical protein